MISSLNKTALNEAAPAFDFKQQYIQQDELYGLEGRPLAAAAAAPDGSSSEQQQRRHYGPQWALLRFDQPVTAPQVNQDFFVDHKQKLFFLQNYKFI